MNNQLVAYSRAGDVFHYRWAARRCLGLLYPNTTLKQIVIEGSNEIHKAGEYVIDVTEYSKTTNGDKEIAYYQLKHTTTRRQQPIHLADLKQTIQGFADRFRQHERAKEKEVSITFNIVTNRKVDQKVKDQLVYLAMGEKGDSRFLQTIEKYTKLKGKQLAGFCALFDIEDGEGDYKVQNTELRVELSQLVAGTISNTQAETLTNMVQEKVLPDSDHVVTREDVLKRFGFTNQHELFPAPPLWEKLDQVIVREQYAGLIDAISDSENPVIIYAAGGIGKTVFCRHLINSVPEYSLTIAYDCFGAGSYRNRSSFRHRYRDALVQIGNELATKGICQPMLVFDTNHDDDILRSFLQRLEAAVTSLQKVNKLAKLFIVIDAADNAEMAAEEFKDNCFAHELLREKVPQGCKLIMLCRTERKYLLKPGDNVLLLELKAFSEEESLQNLTTYFGVATKNDGLEFHRLTGGNPRVQANALSVSHSTVTDLLLSFGPNPMTVEMQIENQLRAAVAKIKDAQTPNFQESIKAICVGLASLPPHIPISILASAAGVSNDAISSFVADLGRPLWVSDSSVQFRDEPTETWFRKTYLGTKENYNEYISRLEPLAGDSTYVAEVLPQLYLQAGEYDKLIRMALSDELLPVNNPIDARNVRIFRLRFAFIAALKSDKLKDAVQLAIRAGEEVAGSNRQFFLFKNNIDLLATLQGKEKVQEIAFKSKLRGGWDGSENVYTASLLSAIPEYKGEARGYLRAADNWLSIYFKRKKTDDDDHPHSHDERLTEQDILEFTYAHFNINGVIGAVDFINHLKPKEYLFQVVGMLAKRFIDLGQIDIVYQFAEKWKDEPYYVVAIAHELLKVGKFLQKEVTSRCLTKLNNAKTRITKPKDYFYDNLMGTSVISFIENCFHFNLDAKKVTAALNYYVPLRANNMVVSNHSSKDREIYLKALAMRLIMSGKKEIDIEDVIPGELLGKKKEHKYENELKEYKEYINGLLPWYMLRSMIMRADMPDFDAQFNVTVVASQKARTNRYSNYDPIPTEITGLVASILMLGNKKIVATAYTYLSSDKDFNSRIRLNLLRAVYRSVHLETIADSLEKTTYELIESLKEEGPDEISEKYILLARAVSIHSVEDASIYFDKAVEIVSKFGDELVRRWEAVQSLASRASELSAIDDEFAYRFIRCAELVGVYISREKYWDRSAAAEVNAKMSPGTALAAVSRWRDRIIGRYQYQLLAIVKALVKNETISPLSGWALSHFFEDRLYGDLAILCIERETTKAGKQMILNEAVRYLQTEGAQNKYVDDLRIVASRFGLENAGLQKLVNFFALKNKEAEPNSQLSSKNVKEHPNSMWDPLFEGLTIHSPDGISKLLARFKELPKDRFNYYSIRDILPEALSRIKQTQLSSFIDAMLVADEVDIYDAKAVLTAIPESWKNKPAFMATWPSHIKNFGKQFAHDLVNKYTFDYAVTDLSLNNDLTKELKHGMYQGLQNENALNNEETFFGFCGLSASLLQPDEAFVLTDYAMCRFELHIDDNFGDGNYGPKVAVEGSIYKSVAGFVWSALGSPWGWERWNATHTVRSMGEFNCREVIEELFTYAEAGEVGPYGSADYIFYKLHATQYFLIALARIALENPKNLLPFAGKISEYALNATHLLIQRFAKQTALSIEAAFAGTYDTQTLDQLRKIGISPFKRKKEKFDYQTDSVWHKRNDVDKSVEFHFGWDFDRYWYQPLGDVFGIPGKQIEELASEVIINDWELGDRNGHSMDPRVSLWNRSSSDHSTWHDHGSYPKTDTLDFYLSYHAMMVVAAKLIKEMPVIDKRDWKEDAWGEWLEGHILTMEDGRWLSDIRDPLPLKRPDWIRKERTSSWSTDITEADFRERLVEHIDGKPWITVSGGWHEKASERKEDVSIRSAFVNKETSDALLRALQSCDDPHDYKIPDYEESNMEFGFGKFVLKGWVNHDSGSKRLDKMDRYSADVSYPILSPGKSILSDLNLEVSFNTWKDKKMGNQVMRCENWSTDSSNRDEYTDQCGMCLKADLRFLQNACKKYSSELIIKMTIERDLIVSRMGGSNDYGKEFVKLLIVSDDGTIRTTEGNFRIG